MPWKCTEPLLERRRFVALYLDGIYSMSELCRRFEISRKCGYGWVRRWEAEGDAGLVDRSRAPLTCPHRIDAAMADTLVALRQRHPTWGAEKLRDYLLNQRPGEPVPAASSIGELLRKKGLTQGKPRRPRPPASTPAGKLITTAPNQVWCADFKGEFRTGDGRLCYPLTVTDAHSRFLLACVGMLSPTAEGTREVFDRLFTTAGLPGAIRTDNGTPFVTQAVSGLSQVSLRWLWLGIDHQRIRPGKPTENGRHERMHRTLKAETARPPADDLAGQQERFRAFQEEFNGVRPHEALGGRTPGSVWVAPERQRPAEIPLPRYPGYAEVRKVRHDGEILFAGQQVWVSEVLAGETVGLVEVDEGLWDVHYYDRSLGRLRAGGKHLIG